MRAAISALVLLLLLLSVNGVQTGTHSPDVSTDVPCLASTELKELRDVVVDLRGRLEASESKVEALERALQDTNAEMKKTQQEIQAAPKVAFSASLQEGFTESGSNHLNLTFSTVFTNVGEAYNSTTGFFTAPVGGVYYFRFTVMDRLDSRIIHINLHKNGKQLLQLYETDEDGQPSYLSSGLALQLEKGDTVNLVLPRGLRLLDFNNESHSTFSGFLLFPL